MFVGGASMFGESHEIGYSQSLSVVSNLTMIAQAASFLAKDNNLRQAIISAASSSSSLESASLKAADASLSGHARAPSLTIALGTGLVGVLTLASDNKNFELAVKGKNGLLVYTLSTSGKSIRVDIPLRPAIKLGPAPKSK